MSNVNPIFSQGGSRVQRVMGVSIEVFLMDTLKKFREKAIAVLVTYFAKPAKVELVFSN